MTVVFATLANHPTNLPGLGDHFGRLVAVELPPTWRPLSGPSEIENAVAHVRGLMRGDSPGSAADAMVEADRILGNVLAMLWSAPPIIELPDGSQLHRSPSDALREIAWRYFREGNLCTNDSTEAELDRWFDELWKKEKLP